MKAQSAGKQVALKRKRSEAEEEDRAQTATASEDAKSVTKRRRVQVKKANQPPVVTLSRQAVLKRKRDEVEEADRTKAVKANSERDARALKRQRLRADEAEPRVEALQRQPRRLEPIVAPQDQVRDQENQPRPAETEEVVHPDQTSGTVTQEQPIAAPRDQARVQEHQQRPAETEETTQRDPARDTVTEAQSRSRPVPFMRVLVQNVAYDLKRCRINRDYERWSRYEEDLLYGNNGLQQLDGEIALKESWGHDTWYLRRVRIHKQAEVSDAKNYREWAGASAADLKKHQIDHNSRIYSFADIPREAKPLECLSQDFWDMFDKCLAANTVRKDLELELHRWEERQESQGDTIVQYSCRAVPDMHDDSEEADLPAPNFEAEDSSESLQHKLSPLDDRSHRKEELRKTIPLARDEQSQFEAMLNRIAYDLFVKCGRIHAEPSDANATEQDPRSGGTDVHSVNAAGSAPQRNRNAASENDTQDDRRATNDAEEQTNNSAALDRANFDGRESRTHIDDTQAAPSSRPARDLPTNRQDQEEQARQEARIEGNRCQIHQNLKSLTDDAVVALRIKVAEAREKLAFCQHDFHDARYVIPEEALLLGREQQGPFRLDAMNQRSRALIEAQDACKEALREAQDARVIVNEPCQTSNFCGCDSEDKTFTTNSRPGPMLEIVAKDIQGWVDQVCGDDQSVAIPDMSNDVVMDWDKLPELGFGECDEDIVEEEDQPRLDGARVVQETLRRDMVFENAENRHDGHRCAGMSSETNPPWEWSDNSRPVQPSAPPRQVSQEPQEDLQDLDEHQDNADPAEPDDDQPPASSGNGRVIRYDPDAVAEDHEDISNSEKPDDNRRPASNGIGPPFDPSASLVDYAVDGYEGDNMDGIE